MMWDLLTFIYRSLITDKALQNGLRYGKQSYELFPDENMRLSEWRMRR